MAIRNLRDSKDIDLIVTNEFWQKLKQKYPDNVKTEPERIAIGNIEIWNNWYKNMFSNLDKLIAESEMIEALPFVRLEYVGNG